MNADTSGLICAQVQRKLGLAVDGHISDGELTITPAAYHPNDSFSIHFRPGWRSAEAELKPGPFSGPALRSMGLADEAARNLFTAYCHGLAKAGVSISMQVNSTAMNPLDPGSWPELWSSLSIVLRKTALVFDLNKDPELMPVADLVITPLFAMAISLIGTEAEESEEGAVEGAATQYLATRYERKKLNRDACIRIHGTDCVACGFSFLSTYGELAEGYIEVHHIESLAQSGVVIINPAIDLVPLCSNCHSVVHRVSPPLPIAELRKLVKEGRAKCSAV